MKIQNIRPNISVVTIGTTQILFSYSTPVAARTSAGNFRTDKYFSRTTSRHINAWDPTAKTWPTKPQSYFEGLTK